MNQKHMDTIHKTLKWFYDVAYDTDELARTEEALAALEALRRQLAEAQRWQPLPDGEYGTLQAHATYRVIVRGADLEADWDGCQDRQEIYVGEFRLCRQAAAQEGGE